MKIIGRFFICIWFVLYFILCMCGGFILFPIIRYILIGQFDDPIDVTTEIYIIVKNRIEDFFDNIKFKCNDKFWE